MGSITNRGVFNYTWPALVLDDAGAAVEVGRYRGLMVQFSGTYGGATVSLQGSVDGTNWDILKDDQGLLVSFDTGTQMSTVTPARFVRPITVGGDGTTALVAQISAAVS